MTAIATLRRGRRRTGPGPGEGFDRRLIAPMVAGSLLNPINSSMIAVALVPIGVAFGAPPAQTVWLVSALYLATAVGQPVVGRLVDLYGPRRALPGRDRAGRGSPELLGALAPSLGVLVAARVLLGFGTCAGYPAAMFLIRSEARAHRAGQPERRPDRARDRQPDHRRRRPHPRRPADRPGRLAHHLRRQHPAVPRLPASSGRGGCRGRRAREPRRAGGHASRARPRRHGRCSPRRSPRCCCS